MKTVSRIDEIFQSPVAHVLTEAPTPFNIRYTRAFVIRVFSYLQFYFSIMRNINILSAVFVQAAAQAR
jgi:hypothetical protein